jgi:hypothetical protein
VVVRDLTAAACWCWEHLAALSVDLDNGYRVSVYDRIV